MSAPETLVAPFPYFGGKRRAAEIVWRALGDPGGYVEPFAGSAAVLLARPPMSGRRVETINDADGWLVNAWRAIQLAPIGRLENSRVAASRGRGSGDSPGATQLGSARMIATENPGSVIYDWASPYPHLLTETPE